MSPQDTPSDLQPLALCTVSHGIEDFDLLIEDLERIMPGQWGDLRFDEALPFLEQPDAGDLQGLIFALDEDDVGDLERISDLIAAIAPRQVPIILVCDGLTPDQLKIVLRHGGDEYMPYPPEAGALHAALDRVKEIDTRNAPAAPIPAAPLVLTAEARSPEAEAAPEPEPVPEPPASAEDAAPDPDEDQSAGKGSLLAGLGRRLGRNKEAEPAPAAAPPAPSEAPERGAPRKSGPSRIIAAQGLIGGAGASTLAVNLAHELAQGDKHRRKSVCLIDFDVQFGTVALHRDLSEKAAVVDLLSDTESMDDDAFQLALQHGEDGVDVLTAPEDLIPMDFINSDDVAKLIDTAARSFDFVVIDMPRTIQDWTETVITRADRFMTVLQVDVASAQNVLRLRRALQAEGIPTDSLHFVLNRAPRRTELSARGRMQSMAQSLGITFDAVLPSDPAAATAAADQGTPLAKVAAKSPLRKAIASLAQDIIASQNAPAA